MPVIVTGRATSWATDEYSRKYLEISLPYCKLYNYVGGTLRNSRIPGEAYSYIEAYLLEVKDDKGVPIKCFYTPKRLDLIYRCSFIFGVVYNEALYITEADALTSNIIPGYWVTLLIKSSNNIPIMPNIVKPLDFESQRVYNKLFRDI